MASLYKINEAILNCVDMETGEIIDPEALEELQMAFDDKVEGIALWVKNLIAEAEMIKVEKDNLAKRQSACENRAKSLKVYLSKFLDGQKFKTSRVSISYRKSESVEVIDMSAIGKNYLKYSEPTVDKTAIKKAIKNGKDVTGARLVENSNIQIR